MNKTIIIIGIIVAALGISGLMYANAEGATLDTMNAHDQSPSFSANQ